MAKMFYTLEEAAEKLGVDEQTIKDMAGRGDLQQFRDRDKLMFKRDQVDAKASDSNADTASGLSGGPIPLADTGMNDAVSLTDDNDATSFGGQDLNDATGVSVFDAGDVEMADPMAQTQVTQPMMDDEDLALESVGSGSGLLDLTRESDDTSLGAELLDDIYTGSETGSDIKMDSAVGSSGVFDSAVSMETGTSGPSGLESLSTDDGITIVETPSSAPTQVVVEESDPAGSGFGAGMLFGVLIALILGLFTIIPTLAGVPSAVTGLLVSESGNYTMVAAAAGGLLVLSVIMGVVGMVIGKAAAS